MGGFTIAAGASLISSAAILKGPIDQTDTIKEVKRFGIGTNSTPLGFQVPRPQTIGELNGRLRELFQSTTPDPNMVQRFQERLFNYTHPVNALMIFAAAKSTFLSVIALAGGVRAPYITIFQTTSGPDLYVAAAQASPSSAFIPFLLIYTN